MPDAVPPADGRVIGRHRGDDGPIVVAICAIHGNEPASIEAASRVFRWLADAQPAFRGELIALVGHRSAVAADRRYFDRDLNRVWGADDVRSVRQGVATARDREHDEQAALLAHFEAIFEGAAGRPVVGLDLHSFSANGAPFNVTNDDPFDIALADCLALPTILSLHHYIRGTILEFFIAEGRRVVGVEAGRHDDPRTVAIHEAAILETMVALDMVSAESTPHLAGLIADARHAGLGLPHLVEVRHRHPVHPGDGFRMRPGFHNFQPVYAGQPLADDVSGVIVAPWSGWILMPLYQGQGADGFFIATERSTPRPG